ncbi:M13 family metallopeptidase [Companilactobacillus furfuricola]|uniref:M13 family metallopeptidase n=1 Tax=Companilactobacillus furfuricola TaxID=1462575 RepID=UPI0013DE60DE|nr:M13 family metallopeptidase [Companilactobacillus furfuricola]
MKIQNQLLKATMFTAVLLGASITSQTVKADETNDANTTNDSAAKSEKQAVPLYNGFKSTDEVNDNVATTQSAASQTSARETTATNVSSNDENIAQSGTNQFKPQNDYYDYVNHKWLQSTDVDSTKADAGSIPTAQAQIDQQVQDKFESYVDGTIGTKDKTMQKALDFYNLYLSKNYSNMTDVSKDAFSGLRKVIDQIDSLQDLSDFSKHMDELMQEGVTLPIGVKVDIDQRNPELRALYFYGASPILLDEEGQTSNGHSQTQDIIGSALNNAGVPWSTIQGIMINASKFDEILVKNQSAADIKTDGYQNGYQDVGIHRQTNYLPVNYVNFSNMPVFIDMDHFVNQLVGMTPGYVYEMTPSFYNNINEIMIDENFAEMKAWMIANYVADTSNYIAKLQNNFPTIEGETKAQFNKRMAYYLTKDAFSDAFSKYFGDVLLPTETKNAVTNMAENIRSAYKEEISNSWLDGATKKAALEKLDDMTMNIGYPTQSYSYYNQVDINDDSDFYQIYRNIVDAKNYAQFSNYQKPVDRTEWGVLNSLNTNAQYVRSRNAMYIGTGIIQAPFFDINATDSQNYGGLGTIIGHELSHAFDSTGSLFDKDGLFNNWWSAADKEQYDAKYQQIVKAYDNIDFHNVSISGQLTADENLADNAGLDVAEKALKLTNTTNWDQFFKSYAKVNHYKYYFAKDDAQALLDREMALATDPHSPFPVRVDVSLQNNDQFAKTYGVKPSDGMWIDPDQRIDFWAKE